MRPASSHATWRTRRTWPVSASTSTTATWAPNGNVGTVQSNVVVAARAAPPSSDAAATSAHAERHGRGAGDVEAPDGGVEHDVGDIGFEPVGGDPAGDVDELGGGGVDRGATDLQRPGAQRAAAGRHDVGVAPHDADRLDRQAGVLGGDHRPRRLVALAVRGRAGVDDGGAVGGRPRSSPSRCQECCW